MRKNHFKWIFVLGCILIFATACGSAQAPATIASPSATPLPQPNPTVPPTLPPPPTQPPVVIPTAATGGSTVKIFLVALGDKGSSGQLIGCDDSIIPVTIKISPTQGVLRAALNELLSVRQQYYGQSGLYNALYQSDLKLDQVVIENKRAIIHLSGTMALGGVCDNPRVEAQLKQTALQFSTINQVSIFVNNKPLEDVLSGK